MSDNLVQRLRDLAEEWFEMCEDIHEPLYEAADRIEALTAETERLRNEYVKNGESHVVSNLRSIADEQAARITKLEDLLDAWVQLAREHLDSELAGRTFAALLEGENRD